MTIIQKIKESRDRGATPLEILAGLVLLGIIFGFLIVKFFGWRESTQDKGAQGQLRSALLAAETVYQQEADYLGTANDAVAALQAVEPEINFDDDGTVTAGEVEVTTGANLGSSSADDGQAIMFQAISDSGNSFCILSIADSPTMSDVGTYYGAAAEGSAVASCDTSDRTDGFPAP